MGKEDGMNFQVKRHVQVVLLYASVYKPDDPTNCDEN